MAFSERSSRTLRIHALSNETGWIGKYFMLDGFFKLKNAIDKLDELKELTLSKKAQKQPGIFKKSDSFSCGPTFERK